LKSPPPNPGPLPGDLVGMTVACHNLDMANLQVKNIPDSLHDRLRSYARESGRTISAVMLAAIERELEDWEFQKQLAEHPNTYLSVSAADVIREERALREMELGWPGSS
jgi:predicted DNA-binding protein